MSLDGTAGLGSIVRAPVPEHWIDEGRFSSAGFHALVSRMAQQATVLPVPGSGHTLERWDWLARVGSVDLCLVKVLEAHYDALAIAAELGQPATVASGLWAVWAAEAPNAVASIERDASGAPVLCGSKAWTSGADVVTHALLTAREGEQRRLVAVDVRDPRVVYHAGAWQAVGMARVSSGVLAFDRVPIQLIGEPDDYLTRPGFWHGGAGIAASWHGGACGIAETLRRHPRVASDAHAAAHLGAIDARLRASAALLREVAAMIDADPGDPHTHAVGQVRAFVEGTCTEVIERCGRALGAAPLCLDRAHAQRCADLAVFIRQSHAERDLEQLGRHVATLQDPWSLQRHD